MISSSGISISEISVFKEIPLSFFIFQTSELKSITALVKSSNSD
jgi:hypothetical protein